jgi:hypothetical protein
MAVPENAEKEMLLYSRMIIKSMNNLKTVGISTRGLTVASDEC